jgi:hypothetical protein
MALTEQIARDVEATREHFARASSGGRSIGDGSDSGISIGSSGTAHADSNRRSAHQSFCGRR